MKKFISLALTILAITSCGNKGQQEAVIDGQDSIEAEAPAINSFEDMNLEQLKEKWTEMTGVTEAPTQFALKDLDGDGIAELALRGGKDNANVLLITKEMTQILYAPLEMLQKAGTNIMAHPKEAGEAVFSNVNARMKDSKLVFCYKVTDDYKADKTTYTDMLTGKALTKAQVEEYDKVDDGEEYDYIYFDWEPLSNWNKPENEREALTEPLDKCWKQKVKVQDYVTANINSKGEVELDIIWDKLLSKSNYYMDPIAFDYDNPDSKQKVQGLSAKAIGLFTFYTSIYILLENKHIVELNVENLREEPVFYATPPLCKYGKSMYIEVQEESFPNIMDINGNSIFINIGSNETSLCAIGSDSISYSHLVITEGGQLIYAEGQVFGKRDVIYVGIIDSQKREDYTTHYTYHIQYCQKNGGKWESDKTKGEFDIVGSKTFDFEYDQSDIIIKSGLNFMALDGQSLKEPRKGTYYYHFAQRHRKVIE